MHLLKIFPKFQRWKIKIKIKRKIKRKQKTNVVWNSIKCKEYSSIIAEHSTPAAARALFRYSSSFWNFDKTAGLLLKKTKYLQKIEKKRKERKSVNWFDENNNNGLEIKIIHLYLYLSFFI